MRVESAMLDLSRSETHIGPEIGENHVKMYVSIWNTFIIDDVLRTTWDVFLLEEKFLKNWVELARLQSNQLSVKETYAWIANCQGHQRINAQLKKPLRKPNDSLFQLSDFQLARKLSIDGIRSFTSVRYSTFQILDNLSLNGPDWRVELGCHASKKRMGTNRSRLEPPSKRRGAKEVVFGIGRGMGMNSIELNDDEPRRERTRERLDHN